MKEIKIYQIWSNERDKDAHGRIIDEEFNIESAYYYDYASALARAKEMLTNADRTDPECKKSRDYEVWTYKVVVKNPEISPIKLMAILNKLSPHHDFLDILCILHDIGYESAEEALRDHIASL